MSPQREAARGERVLPGLWRLRLPLPWPGVPHCNAWAIAAGDGIVLVDTGMHEPGSLTQLERALDQVGLRLEQVRQLVCTHAHSDHWGQAGPIIDRSGCELLLHPALEHATRALDDPAAALARRLEVGRQSGVPEAALAQYAQLAREFPSGVARAVAPDRPLLDGVQIETDLGPWVALQTPGHAPSHVCLFQAERRLLISGDHLLGRISLYYDYGYTPDPVGEFLASLDRIDPLDARLALSGHGKPFTDVHGHIEANRRLVSARLAAVLTALDGASRSAAELVPAVYDEPLSMRNAAWLLSQTLCYLGHLERARRVERVSENGSERWTAAAAAPPGPASTPTPGPASTPTPGPAPAPAAQP